MYVAMLAVIVGQAALFGQLGPVGYAAILWAVAASVVRWREEPVLARRFGADYDAYRQAVPAWWPRLRPWTPHRNSPSKLCSLSRTYPVQIGLVPGRPNARPRWCSL
jgi:hypothetical protein